jgi:hypothetical protein
MPHRTYVFPSATIAARKSETNFPPTRRQPENARPGVWPICHVHNFRRSSVVTVPETATCSCAARSPARAGSLDNHLQTVAGDGHLEGLADILKGKGVADHRTHIHATPRANRCHRSRVDRLYPPRQQNRLSSGRAGRGDHRRRHQQPSQPLHPAPRSLRPSRRLRYTGRTTC